MTAEKVLLCVWAVALVFYFRRELAGLALNALDQFGPPKRVTVRDQVSFDEALKPPYRAFRSER